MAQTALPSLPLSAHPLADIIYRLEAGDAVTRLANERDGSGEGAQKLHGRYRAAAGKSGVFGTVDGSAGAIAAGERSGGLEAIDLRTGRGSLSAFLKKLTQIG